MIVGYLITKVGGLTAIWNGFTEAMGSVWQTLKDTGTFDRVKAGFMAGINIIKTQFLVVPRAIMKALSLIPSKLLPDGWGGSIKSAQKQLEEMNSGIVNDAKANIEYAVTGVTDKPLQSASKREMLKHPSIQSKSQVEVRIKSDKPVELTQAKSDKHTEMMVDTGELLGSGF